MTVGKTTGRIPPAHRIIARAQPFLFKEINMDINAVTIIGRLCRDIEVTYTTTGTTVGKMSIACNHMKKEEVSFFDVKLFGKLVENLKDFLTRGKQVCIEGYLKQERWESNGQKFSRICVIANNVQLLGGRTDGSTTGNNAPSGDDYGYGYGN